MSRVILIAIISAALAQAVFAQAGFAQAAFAQGSVVVQTAQPALADRAALPQSLSYSSVSTTSSPSDSMTKMKETAKACYPVFAECTKNSDCCSGFCRAGRVAAYCDNK